MVYSGALVKDPGFNDGDLSIEYMADEKLKGLIWTYMKNNFDSEVAVSVHIIVPEGDTFRYCESRTYNGIIEDSKDYDGIGLFVTDFLMRVSGQISIRPVAHSNACLLLSNFNKDDCKSFGADFVEIEA